MEKDIQKCLELLRAGGTILYPTDTIWGIGCDATNEKAVGKVLHIKKRKVAAPTIKGESPDTKGRNTNISLQSPFWDLGQAGGKSFIVLVSDEGMLNRFVKDVPAQAWDLIEVSDTPITIIYDAARGLAKNILADDGSIGVRIVNDDFCRKLIYKFGKPIVSSSANISGTEPPKNFSEISSEILSQADYVVNWRRDEIANSKASSIIKLKANGEFQIIRF